MAKLNNKSIDTNQILSHPKETWSERFMRKALSNAMVLTIFTTFFGYIKKCFGQEHDAWDVAMGKVKESFQYSRKVLLIFICFLLITSFIAALIKKAFWWQVLCNVLLFLLMFIFIFISYTYELPIGIDDITFYCALIAYICLFPCLFYYILYKCKRVTRKTAMHNIVFNIVACLVCVVFICCLSFL